jgi:hypothetical protein
VTVAAILLGFSTPSCPKSTIQKAATRAPDPVQEADIREAVIRYQMTNWLTQADKDERGAKSPDDKQLAATLNFKVYFISINGKDPSDSFMQRFRDVTRVVKKASEARQDRGNLHSFVHDKKSHQPGIIFSADGVHWVTTDSVQVDGGYHCSGLCGGGFVYSLQSENGKWVVKSAKMTFIS